MNGKVLMGGMLALMALFAAGLIWFQFFAYYERVTDVDEITVDELVLKISDYDGIDAESSGLKLRACFNFLPEVENQPFDTAELKAIAPPEKPTPLNPPFWFDCFDAGQIQADLDAGNAFAVQAKENDIDGIDRIVVFYPDGRGFMWRQLNAKFQD